MTTPNQVRPSTLDASYQIMSEAEIMAMEATNEAPKAYQRVPVDLVNELMSSPKTAVRFLLYLKIRSMLTPRRGMGGEFRINQQLADYTGHSLKNIRENVNKGILYGWFRRCKHDKDRYEIVSTHRIGAEKTLQGEYCNYASFAKLDTRFLLSVSWKNIGTLRSWAIEQKTSNVLVREIGIQRWKDTRRIQEIMQETGCTKRAAKRLLTKERKAQHSTSPSALTSSIEGWSALRFQASQTGYSASTIQRHRERLVRNSDLSSLARYECQRDEICGYGAVYKGYGYDAVEEMNIALDRQVEQGKVPLAKRGKYIILRGKCVFVHISVRHSTENLEIRRQRIRGKYREKNLLMDLPKNVGVTTVFGTVMENSATLEDLPISTSMALWLGVEDTRKLPSTSSFAVRPPKRTPKAKNASQKPNVAPKGGTSSSLGASAGVVPQKGPVLHRSALDSLDADALIGVFNEARSEVRS